MTARLNAPQYGKPHRIQAAQRRLDAICTGLCAECGDPLTDGRHTTCTWCELKQIREATRG